MLPKDPKKQRELDAKRVARKNTEAMKRLGVLMRGGS